MRAGVTDEKSSAVSRCFFFLFFSMAEQHFTEVVGSEEFLNLGMEQVSSLIASDKLTIPTEEKVRTHTLTHAHMVSSPS